jgi:hypothetical protein
VVSPAADHIAMPVDVEPLTSSRRLRLRRRYPRSFRLSRQVHSEDTPLAGDVSDADFAAVCSGSLATDDEPKSDAGTIGTALFVGVEQLLGLSRRQTATSITLVCWRSPVAPSYVT